MSGGPGSAELDGPSPHGAHHESCLRDPRGPAPVVSVFMELAHLSLGRSKEARLSWHSYLPLKDAKSELCGVGRAQAGQRGSASCLGANRCLEIWTTRSVTINGCLCQALESLTVTDDATAGL